MKQKSRIRRQARPTLGNARSLILSIEGFGTSSCIWNCGNHYFSEQTIRERLFMEAARLPRFPYGRFNDAYLQQDVQAIRNLYASNGFRDVKVTSRIQDDYGGAEGHLAVFIQIEEGPQWFVSDLSIEGAAVSDRQVLEGMLASSKNQPFSEASVADDRDNFLNYYYSRGYLNATFDYDTTPAERPTMSTCGTLLRPGARKYVREVLVSGLETTRSRLVYDRLELRSGEPLSLSKETDSQRRLYDLGIFARVNTAFKTRRETRTKKTFFTIWTKRATIR